MGEMDVVTEYERQAIVDEEHLKMLSLGFWVWGGFTVLYSLFIAAYFGLIGSVFIAIPNKGVEAPPAFLGWVFLGLGTAIFVLAAGLGGLEIATGFWIRRRKHRVVTMVIAALLCAAIPFGTLLGVLTLITLSRPSVKFLYDVARGGSAAVTVEATDATDMPDADVSGT
jgi:hypothetical protein